MTSRAAVVLCLMAGASGAHAQVIANKPPQIAIASPAVGFTYDAGTSSSVTLSGTGANITACTWTNSLGGSGSTSLALSGATLTWTAGTVSLTVGSNILTVTCGNGAGRSVATAITVTRSASCSTTLSAGSSTATVNTTIGSAADGDEICFSAGAYTWPNGGAEIAPSLTKSVTLTCVSVGACDVSVTGNVYQLPAGTSTKLYRISGFDWTITSALKIVETCGGGACTTTYIGGVGGGGFRFDHNTVAVSNNGSVPLFFGDGATITSVYGVIDHNTFTSAQSFTASKMLGDYDATPIANPQGTLNNMVFEDNTFTITEMDNAGAGIIDIQGESVGVVFRFNDVTNGLITTHGIVGGGGHPNLEVYGNHSTISNATDPQWENCSRSTHDQGSGPFVYWKNSCTPAGGAGHTTVAGSILHYRSSTGAHTSPWNSCDGTSVGGVENNPTDGNRTPLATYRGYPCFRQPGRDFSGNASPMFSFGNFFTDDNAMFNLEIELIGGTNDYTTLHMIEDRDLFSAVSASEQSTPSSPFNGTTGMGFGTLANRPTSCTKGTEAADDGLVGVMYAAKDSGSNWNTSSSNGGVNLAGDDWVVYRCADDSPVTWALHYTPITYPHPLVVN